MHLLKKNVLFLFLVNNLNYLIFFNNKIFLNFYFKMAGCFCDCFGGFKNLFSNVNQYNKPIDINALNHCLKAVYAHEQNKQKV